jgi:hypothetical protein
MKLTITITDIDPDDLERLSSALANNPELWPSTRAADVSDDEAQKATSAYETLQANRKAQLKAADLAENQPEEPDTGEPDATVERSDAAQAGITGEAERREFITLCDRKWKRSKTLQVEGTTKTLDDEVMDAATGEVLALRILYRGRAIVENEAGEWRLVEARQLKLTGEDQVMQEAAKGGGNGATAAPADEDAEDVISADDLRALAQNVVNAKGARFVLNTITEHCGKPLRASQVPVEQRNSLATLLRGALT